jgi:hypothetical protein
LRKPAYHDFSGNGHCRIRLLLTLPALPLAPPSTPCQCGR